MTQIVAGVFDDEQAATAVAHELRGAGFDAADLDQFALNPPGRTRGCRWAATRSPTRRRRVASRARSKARRSARPWAPLPALRLRRSWARSPSPEALRRAPTRVRLPARSRDGRRSARRRNRGLPASWWRSTPIRPKTRNCAVDLLRDHGARMIERADGTWRNGKWADFDPVRPPRRHRIARERAVAPTRPRTRSDAMTCARSTCAPRAARPTQLPHCRKAAGVTSSRG